MSLERCQVLSVSKLTDIYEDCIEEDSFYYYCNIFSLKLYLGRFFSKYLNKDYI